MILKQSDLNSTQFDNQFMLIALQEAQKAYLEGEVPVGCVIVHRTNRKIIAKTHNMVQQRNNPNLHAEIIAINTACELINSKNLSNYDIYVTLEPCTMCASAISNARLGRLYYGAEDSKQGAVENGVRFFTSPSCLHKPEIYSDINNKPSEKMLNSFFNSLRKN